jgi:hypothetical protein
MSSMLYPTILFITLLPNTLRVFYLQVGQIFKFDLNQQVTIIVFILTLLDVRKNYQIFWTEWYRQCPYSNLLHLVADAILICHSQLLYIKSPKFSLGLLYCSGLSWLHNLSLDYDSLSKVNRHFGVEYRLHLHRQRRNHTRIESETEGKQNRLRCSLAPALRCLYWLILEYEE